MKFKINKELREGRYFVKVELLEFTDSDRAKAAKFGYPVLKLKHQSGKEIVRSINTLNMLEAYGFYDQNEADEYSQLLKSQIKELQENWAKLEDKWSDEEIL